MQLRLSHLLNTADLEPSAIPPAAILVVRHLPDPLPHRLCSDLYAHRPATDWECATRSALDDFGRRAARPADGAVPPTACAVVFADTAELLACLVRDVSSGQAAFHWWWRALPRGIRTTPAEEIVSALRREPRHIPAVLAQLHRWRELNKVASLLTLSQVQVLLRDMIFAQGLQPLLAAASRGSDQPAAVADVDGDSRGANARKIESPVASPVFPWEPTVEASATPASFGLERCALVGIGLLLHRAPHRARSLQFENAVRIWARDFSLRNSYTAVMQLPAREQQMALESSSPDLLEGAPPSSMFEREDDARNGDIARANSRPAREIGSSSAREKSTEQATVNKALNLPLCRPQRVPDHNESALSSGVETELGGALFLIPFLRALGLPGILESEFRIEQSIGGWALLEVTVCGLLGRSYQRVAHDPLWSALRLLDGRGEFDPPATSFAGSQIYRLPAAWRGAIPAQAARGVTLRLSGRRLLIRHSLGFPLVDWKPPTQVGRHELVAELANLRSDGILLDRLGRCSARRKAALLGGAVPYVCGSNPELLRFLHFILPYFRWRLFDALAPRGLSLTAAVANLLHRRGQLYVTSTHIDLVMDLKHVSLPVRLAGLDANPGWVPELGRVVTFHYR